MNKTYKIEYNKSESGFYTKCGKCDAKISGGDPVYIPKIFSEGCIKFDKPICEKCYKEVVK